MPVPAEDTSFFDFLLEVERMLIKNFQWNLHDLDQTDVESLIDFITGFSHPDSPKTNRVYCDQVSFL